MICIRCSGRGHFIIDGERRECGLCHGSGQRDGEDCYPKINPLKVQRMEAADAARGDESLELDDIGKPADLRGSLKGKYARETIRESRLNEVRAGRKEMISVILPIRTVSEANMREYWHAKAKRAKTQRLFARLAVQSEMNRTGLHSVQPGGTSITLTRIGKRMLDCDNLARALKAVRDGVADALGIDDGDKRLVWVYGQEVGKEYGVRIEIMA